MTVNDLIESAASGKIADGAPERMASDAGLTIYELYDRVARVIAERFCRGEYQWDYCDGALNALYSYALSGTLTGLGMNAMKIYDAFDAGEYVLPTWGPAEPRGEARTRKLLVGLIESCGT